MYKIVACLAFTIFAGLGNTYAQSIICMHCNPVKLYKLEEAMISLYRLEADRGDPKAQFELEEVYTNDRDAPQDDKEAMRLYYSGSTI